VRLGSEASEQPMRENSLLWIGSRACSHKNGIFDWVVVFVSFNTKRKKEFQLKIKLKSEFKTQLKCDRFYYEILSYFQPLLSFFIAKKKVAKKKLVPQ
jgi:hypothetical protein